MAKVFRQESAKELHVELSNGRMIATSKPKSDSQAVPKLKVGEWFRIDRNVIDKNRDEIYRKCIEEGNVGEKLWRRFEAANKIANENPDQYPRLIETYIFEYSRDYKTEQEMRDMCERVGEGMCDEIICDLELQMRICNGESATDLFKKADKLPRVRLIKLRNGGSGYFGGSADNYGNIPPAVLYQVRLRSSFVHVTPYAFRQVLS